MLWLRQKYVSEKSKQSSCFSQASIIKSGFVIQFSVLIYHQTLQSLFHQTITKGGGGGGLMVSELTLEQAIQV